MFLQFLMVVNTFLWLFECVPFDSLEHFLVFTFRVSNRSKQFGTPCQSSLNYIKNNFLSLIHTCTSLIHCMLTTFRSHKMKCSFLEGKTMEIFWDGCFQLQTELAGILKDYVGRESPLYFAERLTEHYKRPNGEGPHIYLKRETQSHQGSQN